MALQSANNKIELLCKKVMMEEGWKAFTPDSIASALTNLTDEDITNFLQNYTEEDIEQLDHKVYYYQIDNES